MFDYLLDRLTDFHTQLLNEQSYLIRKHLISLIKDILKALPEEFDKDAYIER